MEKWSRREVELAAESYFSMLKLELSGISYNKTKFRNKLSELLPNRSDGSIEWKHQNISAALANNNFPHIFGYKPHFNYQKILDSIIPDMALKRDIPQYPISSKTWEILSTSEILKTVDQSCIKHKMTRIPKNVRFYFGADPKAKMRDILLEFYGQEYQVTLRTDPTKTRSSLVWRTDLSKMIKKHCALLPPNTSKMLLFTKTERQDSYNLSIVTENNDENFHLRDEEFHPRPRMEGTLTNRSSIVRKRSQANRLAAIKHHGLNCVVCGFNFEKFYGPLGQGFIEIHHVNPLHEEDGEREVDPVQDLVPVCSNCHRMLHKSSKSIHTIQTLIEAANDYA
ncbi:HNH endonuclease [Desulfovibrio mangrovi]|uniref:HNH endonuclease n=1 Tax=Desulfovibrio mangrovi TaxID=2976983 RepID=UPI0022470569|nr:HNH endonuclease [Desulfovibrio mangrovi]UZP68721.1 HNH endonuclease [Desulfovibrio mangrovi]